MANAHRANVLVTSCLKTPVDPHTKVPLASYERDPLITKLDCFYFTLSFNFSDTIQSEVGGQVCSVQGRFSSSSKDQGPDLPIVVRSKA
uniref:Uncharacterized protein n=1 Tax=Neogobius melanostomus TaxID=47308 RepID=A0A8C6SL39_9GOBI